MASAHDGHICLRVLECGGKYACPLSAKRGDWRRDSSNWRANLSAVAVSAAVKNSAGIVGLNYTWRARRFRFAAFAPSFPKAVRVFVGKREIVRFLFAAAAALPIFLRAATRCLREAMI